MTAQTPQAGIIPEPNQHALFLVTANFHKSGAIFSKTQCHFLKNSEL